jgi:predicted nucleic acid-binding protein
MEIETWIRDFTEVIEPSHTLDVIKEDPDDNRILECAVEAVADVIVSGDKDLHRLGDYRGIRVVTIAEAIDMVIGPGWRTRKP